MTKAQKPPRVFISYAWDDDDHCAWVTSLASRLCRQGIEARLDRWHAGSGSLAAFMENEIELADKILVICSPAYRAKVRAADSGSKTSGAGWEATLIREGLLGQLIDRDKVLVAIGRGVASEVVPLSLRSVWIDLTDPKGFEAAYEQLVKRLWDWRDVSDLGGPRTITGASLPPGGGSSEELRAERGFVTRRAPSFPHSHPYQRGFTGRIADRAELTSWLSTGPGQVLVLEGLGGMGKSALAWVWVNEDVLGRAMTDGTGVMPPVARGQDLRLDGVIWWSFYEAQASASELFSHIASYLGRREPHPSSVDQAASTAVELIRTHRTLLVLDGFERQLIEYVEGTNPPGTEVKRKGARYCSNPSLSRFISDLATAPMSSRVLITSRSAPGELEGLAFARVKRLGGLAENDAAKFLEGQGVQGKREDLLRASRSWVGHPLSLRLLAGALINDPGYRGDIRGVDDIKLTQLRGESVSDRDLRNLANMLWFAYDRLDKRHQGILSQIAGLRFPRPLKDIAALVGDEPGSAEVVLRSLCARGLLLHKTETDTYDLHPSVRGYAYDRLRDKEGTHARMHAYYKVSASMTSGRLALSPSDLRDRIELFHHTVGAKRDGQALDLLLELHADLYYRFGSYTECLNLLRAFVVEGTLDDERTPPRLRLRRWRD